MLTRIGDDLFSLATKDAASAVALASFLRTSGKWLDVVPGMQSVVVRFDPAVDSGNGTAAQLEQLLALQIPLPEASGQVLEIAVAYGGDNGPDLEEVCRRLGISEADFIERHTAVDYPVELIGFTPGFAFLGDLDASLRMPRRGEPRQRVAGGSIAIAGSRTGIYSVASPGGWNLVGRTGERLFRPEDDEPFVIVAGMRVRFRAV